MISAVSSVYFSDFANFSKNVHCRRFTKLTKTSWRRPKYRRHCTLTISVSSEASKEQRIFLPELEQRTQEWLDIRKDRLTASTFANALGLFKGKRVSLWQEKVGLKGAFKGNTATRWGVDNEFAAIEKYKSITGHLVEHIGFKIYKDDETDENFNWLGGSPDGLIEGNESGLFDEKGVLEVKCPHMRGKRNVGVPWSCVPYYYIPQAQGLLEIMDREWMDFYVWTGKGSASFRITRNREYWDFIEGILREFWWENVVPARQAKEEHGDSKEFKEVVKKFKPSGEHEKTDEVIKRSKELAETYPLIWSDVNGNLQPVRAGLNLTLSILAEEKEVLG